MADASGNGSNGTSAGVARSHASLASLAGARVKTVESVSFNARSLDEVLRAIKSLGSTGSLSLSFLNGNVAGEVEWRTSKKER